MSPPPVRRAVVVVPAHNEVDRVGRCLQAIVEASAKVCVPVDTVVVLDRCTDGTAAVCGGYPVHAVTVDAGNVGAARHAGIMPMLAGEPDPASVWLANTDADSVIPPTWLVDQIRLADAGADVVAGVVTIDVHETDEVLRQAFDADYRRCLAADGSHRHVHGANLGVRASAYLGVGGFPPVAAHEDRRLVQRLQRQAFGVVRAAGISVETSGRLSGRCSEGFAARLAGLRPAD